MPAKHVIECFTYDELSENAQQTARDAAYRLPALDGRSNPTDKAREKAARGHRPGFLADGTLVLSAADSPLLLVQFSEREVLDLVCGKRGKRRAVLEKLRAGATASIKSRMVEVCTEVLETVDL